MLAATAAAAPRLGAAATIAIVVSGQVLCSLALDRFGALGLTAHPLTLQRTIAASLLIVGALLLGLERRS